MGVAQLIPILSSLRQNTVQLDIENQNWILPAPTYPLFCETSVTSWLRNDLTKEGTLFQVWSSHLGTKGYPLPRQVLRLTFNSKWVGETDYPIPRLKFYKYVVSFYSDLKKEGALQGDSKLMIICKNQVLPQFYSKLPKKLHGYIFATFCKSLVRMPIR